MYFVTNKKKDNQINKEPVALPITHHIVQVVEGLVFGATPLTNRICRFDFYYEYETTKLKAIIVGFFRGPFFYGIIHGAHPLLLSASLAGV